MGHSATLRPSAPRPAKLVVQFGGCGDTVDGKNLAPLRMPEMLVLSQYQDLFGHPEWCRIFSINRRTHRGPTSFVIFSAFEDFDMLRHPLTATQTLWCQKVMMCCPSI